MILKFLYLQRTYLSFKSGNALILTLTINWPYSTWKSEALLYFGINSLRKAQRK